MPLVNFNLMLFFLFFFFFIIIIIIIMGSALEACSCTR